LAVENKLNKRLLRGRPRSTLRSDLTPTKRKARSVTPSTVAKQRQVRRSNRLRYDSGETEIYTPPLSPPRLPSIFGSDTSLTGNVNSEDSSSDDRRQAAEKRSISPEWQTGTYQKKKKFPHNIGRKSKTLEFHNIPKLPRTWSVPNLAV
jgi:hypothetical protein